MKYISILHIKIPNLDIRGRGIKGASFQTPTSLIAGRPPQLNIIPNRIIISQVQTRYPSNCPMELLDLPNELLLAIIVLIGGFDILPCRLVSG